MIDSFRDEYDWASNFYFKSPFSIGATEFKTNEHYFAANKTLDPEWQLRILSAFKASEAKKLGQQCPIRADWNDVRIWVMANGLFHKFGQNLTILGKLLATGTEEIVEGNFWHDNFWGNCKCENKLGSHPECLQPGHNRLGLLLMNLRLYFQTIQAVQGA